MNIVAVLPGSKAPSRVSRVKMVPWKWQEQEQFTDPTSAKENLSQQGLEQRPFPELQRGKGCAGDLMGKDGVAFM